MSKLLLNEQKALYMRAVDAYYNKDKPIMSDDTFDELERVIAKRDPDWEPLQRTGAKVDKKIEVELPVPAPSLNKRYDDKISLHTKRTGALQIVTDKIDGTALILEIREFVPYRLFTRGDGLCGSDISYLIPSLIKWGKIPARIKKERGFIRFEGVMSESTWARLVDDDDELKNARSTVNGLFNRQMINGKPARHLRDCDLVMLHVYDVAMRRGLELGAKWGFQVVPWIEVDTTDFDWTAHLTTRRAASPYKMDGLCASAPDYVVSPEAGSDKRPRDHVAYKTNSAGPTYKTKVVREIWRKTRLNKWSCKVEIEPVVIDGTTVKHATAHNPAWMQERGVGVGATILIVKGGDVIPKIEEVVIPKKFKGPPGPYEQRGRFFWSPERDRASDVRAIHFFMVTLGIKNLAESTLGKLYDTGFTKAQDYLKIALDGPVRTATAEMKLGSWYTEKMEFEGTPAMFDAIEAFHNAGLGRVTSVNLVQEIKRGLSQTIRLSHLMIASGSFVAGGMGIDKLAQLEAQGLAMRDLVRMKDIKTSLLGYRGFKEKTAALIAEGVAEFREWYRPISGILKVDGALPRQRSGALSGKRIVFTGYRDARQAAILEAAGASVVDSFSSKTDFLVYRANGKTSGKIEQAGARAQTFEQLVKRFNLKG